MPHALSGERHADPQAPDDPLRQAEGVAEREERAHRPQVAAVLAGEDVPERSARRPRAEDVAQEGARRDVQVDLRLGHDQAGALQQGDGEGQRAQRERDQGVAPGPPHGGRRLACRHERGPHRAQRPSRSERRDVGSAGVAVSAGGRRQRRRRGQRRRPSAAPGWPAAPAPSAAPGWPSRPPPSAAPASSAASATSAARLRRLHRLRELPRLRRVRRLRRLARRGRADRRRCPPALAGPRTGCARPACSARAAPSWPGPSCSPSSPAASSTGRATSRCSRPARCSRCWRVAGAGAPAAPPGRPRRARGGAGLRGWIALSATWAPVRDFAGDDAERALLYAAVLAAAAAAFRARGARRARSSRWPPRAPWSSSATASAGGCCPAWSPSTRRSAPPGAWTSR